MTPAQTASALIVTSGAAHAVVNAILKSGRDKMSNRALIDGFSALLVLPAAFTVPLPHGAWGWLALSWGTHLVYLVCLIKAFEKTDMAVAYPIARGVAPALAAAVAVGVFAERLTPAVAVGIALVSTGVGMVSVGQHIERRALLWALATGAMIALYTVVDANGVRAAPSALSYIVWVYLSLGGGSYAGTCDSQQPALRTAIDALRSLGVVTVVASGNDGSPTAISSPACLSGVVAVGSTSLTDVVSSFSSSASGGTSPSTVGL